MYTVPFACGALTVVVMKKKLHRDICKLPAIFIYLHICVCTINNNNNVCLFFYKPTTWKS